MKGLFFKLAGVHSPIVLFLFLLHASALRVPLFPVPVVRNSERVKLRAAFSHQHQTPHMPRPLTLPLLSWRWRKRPAASQHWQSKLWEKEMPKREGRGETSKCPLCTQSSLKATCEPCDVGWLLQPQPRKIKLYFTLDFFKVKGTKRSPIVIPVTRQSFACVYV